LIRFTVFLLLTYNFLFSQNEKIINGKIVCDNIAISGIQITNLANEKSTLSDLDGKFAILAKPEDMLVFTSINYEYKRKFLEQDDFGINNLIINLIKKIVKLDEVLISKNKKFDAVELGILKKPAKEYSPAERRLKNACELKPDLLLSGLMGLSVPIEPIINAVSGRTKNLKNQLEIERKEILLAKIFNLYNDNYYLTKLKITPDLIKAFQYYASEDKQLIGYFKSKNKIKINFRIIELAQSFNKLQLIEELNK
jgi:hypothetical protein